VREATTTWLTLPASAYVLAVITNVGSSLIDLGNAFSPERAATGVAILLAGFLLLEVIAVVAVQRVRNKRTGMAEIDDWRGLVSEVREGGRRRSLRESVAWLEDVEDVFQRLTDHPSGRTRRAARAAEGAAAQVLSWKKRPIAGLVSRRVRGHQRGFHARRAGLYRWMTRSVWVWLWTLCLLLCVAFRSSFYWHFGRTVDWPGTLRLLGYLLAAAFLFVLGLRGRLLYWVRVGLRDASYRAEFRAALDQFAAERQRTEQEPARRRTGLLRRLLGL
jgi:hypothetical protein